MRAFILAVSLVIIPHVVHAQFDFQSGSYLVKRAPELRQIGLLRIDSKNLVVKQTQDGATIKYPWVEVLSYHIGLRRYIRANGFVAKGSFGQVEQVAENTFVELLDSGAVSLMRYQYDVNAGTNRLQDTIYLLRRAGEDKVTIIPYSVFDGAGKKFREALLPFTAERPDLVAVLNDKRINVHNLETLIHVLNKREPFLNYPMQEPLQNSK